MALDENEKIARLRAFGLVIGDRDPRMNSEHAGRFMVCEAYAPDYPGQRDAADGAGFWCIVGDDLEALVNEAWDTFAPAEAAPAP